MIATAEETHTFTDKPIVKQLKRFEFKQISKAKSGVFIVELIGNGISSRAIIKKGRLSLLTEFHHAGTQLTIIDECSNICKGERTGIWIDR